MAVASSAPTIPLLVKWRVMMEGEDGLLGESDRRCGGGVIEHAPIGLRERERRGGPWEREQQLLEGGRKNRP